MQQRTLICTWACVFWDSESLYTPNPAHLQQETAGPCVVIWRRRGRSTGYASQARHSSNSREKLCAALTPFW